MNLYHNHKGTAQAIGEKPFKLERDLQRLVENNLQAIAGLQLVKSEFTIKNKRIDTLAFDTEARAFRIIEYKRDRNYSVVDQGIAYLNLLLEYRADFLVEYNESRKDTLRRSDVDWSQTRVIFVSPFFTDNQKQATNFNDLAIELWEVRQYANESFSVDVIRKSAAAPSIKELKPDHQDSKALAQVAKEIKVYTEVDHLQGKREEIKELYETFRDAILALSTQLELVPQKHYIAFKAKTNIADLIIQSNGIKLWINAKKGTLKNVNNLVKDVSSIGHLGNGDYEISIKDTKNLEYIMSLVKQALI